MGRFIAPLRELIQRGLQAWASLSQRERRMVSLLFVAFVLTGAILGIGSVRKNLASRSEVVAAKELAMQRVLILSSGFQEAEAARKQMEGRLRGNPVRLFSYLEDVARKQKVTIGDMQDRGNDNQGEGVVRSTVEATFSQMNLRSLVRFLNEIERNPRLVKIERVRIRPRSDDPEALDVTLTVSTYHLAES